MSYTQLTQEQRYQIYALLRMGHKQTEIAAVINKHKSTVSRELERNIGWRGYRPKQAQHKALGRRNHSRVRILPETWELIDAKLRLEWSPEQVSGWLERHHAIQISHEWINQHILTDKRAGGDLYRHLRLQKKRRKRYGSYDRRGKLPNRVSIEERPEIVAERQRIGDWEVDTITGKRHRQAIVTLTERKTRFALLRKVEQRSADQVGRAVIDLLQPVSDLLHTITADNGKEFADHQKISQELQADFYFAHPNAAWERGSNENMNGLVRQYIPKSCDFISISDVDVLWIMDRLNHRPRKCLAFRSPFEVFYEQSVALMS
jgi:IS30 family transposase